MKKLFFFICFIFSFPFVFSQISPSDSKIIAKILGKIFVELTPQKSYPYSSLNKNIIADTSLIVPGDTTGIYFNNEFLLFRSSIHFKLGSEGKKMMKTNYVTVGEYQEFQNYVRDSIAREKIYWGLQNNDDAFEYLIYKADKNESKTYFKYDSEKARYESQKRREMRDSLTLNWKKEFSFIGKEESALLSDMYFCQPERFYKKKEFDERKLNYMYYEEYERFSKMSKDSVFKFFPVLKENFRHKEIESVYETRISTITDPYLWARKSIHFKDEFSVLAQNYNLTRTNKPILGILGTQAIAFCHWKQEKLQKELDKNNLNYRVWITLPTFEDQQNQNIFLDNGNKFKITKRDYTIQWQITNEAYEEFINHVKDSILREGLYAILPNDEYSEKLLNYPNTYYDEGSMEWIKINAQNKFGKNRIYNHEPYYEENRYHFNLNFKNKINFNAPTIKAVSKVFLDEKLLINTTFSFYYFDCISKSQHGVYGILRRYERVNYKEWRLLSFDEYEEWVGKDLEMSIDNLLGQNSGVRGHENFQRFIIPMQTPILPDSTSTETETIKKITYSQALAFYHWKYPIQKIKATDNWQDFVLPSKEQFEKIQRGEQIVIEEKMVDFPSPLFRYVVHLYPKTN